jgi:hypothetical protein
MRSIQPKMARNWTIVLRRTKSGCVRRIKSASAVNRRGASSVVPSLAAMMA